MLFYYELLNRQNRKDNFEVVSYPTIISTFVLHYQWLRSDSLLHVEGLLYDISMFERTCTSESMNPRPCFLSLQYRLRHFYHQLPCCFYYFRLQKPISTIHIALVSPSLRRTSAPIQFTIVLGVLGTQETLCCLVAGLFERDHLHPTPPTD